MWQSLSSHIPSVTCPEQDKVFPTWKWGSPLREAVCHFLFWDAMDLLEVAKNIVDLLLDLVFVILLSLLSSLLVVLRRLQMLTDRVCMSPRTPHNGTILPFGPPSPVFLVIPWAFWRRRTTLLTCCWTISLPVSLRVAETSCVDTIWGYVPARNGTKGCHGNQHCSWNNVSCFSWTSAEIEINFSKQKLILTWWSISAITQHPVFILTLLKTSAVSFHQGSLWRGAD